MGVVNNPSSTKLSYLKLKNAVLNPSKSFLALKKVSPRILSTFKTSFSKKMRKTPSSHIIYSVGGEYCWIVWNSEPIRLLKSPRSLSVYTAISRKVVGKSARDNLKRYCGWFWVHCSSKKVDRMAREAIDICLQVVKESNKSRFDSYKVRNSVLRISHITFRDCCVHISSDNLSPNSCILIPFICS